jgi:N-acetylglucosaminyl-diphospho-decaprenol L-rhamnosyltransferase
VAREVTVVVVNWNAGELLRRCLTSLPTGPGVELVVVDNGSTDGSVTPALAGTTGARLIPNAENLGFARACNQGIRAGTGRYVLLLNPDAWLLPGALEALIAFMDAHPDAGAAGPALLDPDGRLQPSGGRLPGLRRLLALHPLLERLLAVPADDLRQRDFGRVAEVEEVSGACLIARRAAVDQVGGLDEGFFLYFEDLDWCLRLRRAGWRIYYLPEARVVHQWRSRHDPSPRAQHHHLRSQRRYVRKHFGRGAAWLLAVLAVAVYAGLLLKVALGGSRQDVRRYRELLGVALGGNRCA